MSIKALNWALEQRAGGAALKAVLLVLADVADDAGESWYSQQRLSDLSEVPVRTLRRYLAQLEERGLLERTGRQRPDGRRSTDVYRLPIASGQNGRSPSPPSGQAVAGPPGQAMAGHEPTVEPVPPTVQDKPAPTGAAVAVVEEVEDSNRVSPNKLVGAWIDRQPARPPGPVVAKQGAAARRLCELYNREQLMMAWVGMDQLFPHSNGEPWDLFDLERKAQKAIAAAANHPEVRERRREAELAAALEGV